MVRSSQDVVLFPLLSRRHISLPPSHDSAWVDDVQTHERQQHRQRIEAVLIDLVLRQPAGEAGGILDQAENDSYLHDPVRSCLEVDDEHGMEKLTIIKSKTRYNV